MAIGEGGAKSDEVSSSDEQGGTKSHTSYAPPKVEPYFEVLSSKKGGLKLGTSYKRHNMVSLSSDEERDPKSHNAYAPTNTGGAKSDEVSPSDEQGGTKSNTSYAPPEVEPYFEVLSSKKGRLKLGNRYAKSHEVSSSDEQRALNGISLTSSKNQGSPKSDTSYMQHNKVSSSSDEEIDSTEPDEDTKPQQQQSGLRRVPKDWVVKVENNIRKAITRRYDEESPPTIYVVPRDLADGNRRAYEPAAVCIGPLISRKRGNGSSSVQNLERYKWCCVRKLILNAAAGRRGRERPAACGWTAEVHAPLLRKCFDTMRDLEPQILASYGTDYGSPVSYELPLQLMMLLDGCFVLHRLLKYARLGRRSGAGEDDDDDEDDRTQKFGWWGVWGIVKRDLLLLNNQIPFFVVQALFRHLKSRANERDDVLVDGALRLFSSLRPGRLQSPTIACRDVHHLLHLFYLSIDLPSQAQAAPQHDFPQRWVPCAMELDKAGVRFRPASKGGSNGGGGGSRSFLDVSFRHGVLEIPQLELFDYSEPLFRNLIAFEQTYPHTPGRITAYAIFMDCLVKTSEDMRLLHQSGVLVSHMNGDRDVATGFFSRVCAEAHTSKGRNYLADVMRDVVTYQNKRRPRWRAALVRNYFSNPWVTTSVVAAAILLVMTVLQTFFTAYAYFKPPN